jgi:rhodanese-related sulfurtransferase
MNLNEKKWCESIQNSENSKILDVRTPEEFDSGFIKESINLNIYVYCRSGSRSFQACELMKQMGYLNVYNLEGGVLDWSGELIK